VPALCAVMVAGVIGTVTGAVGALASAGRAAAQTCGTNLSSAAPSLTVDRTSLSAGVASTVTVTGSRYLTGPYQCGNNKFGGIYVLFGWVQPGGQWGPSWRSSTSAQGQFGTTYTYPGEGGGGDTRDDGSGAVRLVSFTDGGLSGTETPFHMDPAGNWQTTINVRGALYQWTDIASGRTSTVDCRAVQCGVFTVGAHGISSRTNEQFAPITFRSDGPPPTVATGGVSAQTPAAGATGASGAMGAGAGTPNPGAGAGAATGSGASPTPGATGGVNTDAPSSAAPTTADAPGSPATDPGAATTTADPDVTEIAAGGRTSAQVFDDQGGSPLGAIVVVVLLVSACTALVVLRLRRRGRAPTPAA
jgi:hypothetical protein